MSDCKKLYKALIAFRNEYIPKMVIGVHSDNINNAFYILKKQYGDNNIFYLHGSGERYIGTFKCGFLDETFSSFEKLNSDNFFHEFELIQDEEGASVKLYKVIVWRKGSGLPGKRLDIYAKDVIEVGDKVRLIYGDKIDYTLYNEEEAAKIR